MHHPVAGFCVRGDYHANSCQKRDDSVRPGLPAGGLRRRRNGQVAGDSPRVHAHVLLVERPRSHSPLARRGCGTPLPWLRPFHVVTPAGNQRPHFINGFGTLLRPFINNANRQRHRLPTASGTGGEKQRGKSETPRVSSGWGCTLKGPHLQARVYTFSGGLYSRPVPPRCRLTGAARRRARA